MSRKLGMTRIVVGVAFASCVAVTSSAAASGVPKRLETKIASATLTAADRPEVISVPQPLPINSSTSPIDRFTATLLADFPAAYGGLVLGRPGSQAVMLEVGNDQAFESAARTAFQELPGELGVAASPSVADLTFLPVSIPLGEAYDVLNDIESRWKAGELGSSISSIGLGAGNHVVLGTDAPSGADAGAQPQLAPMNAEEAVLAAQYGPVLAFQQDPPRQLTTDRLNDVSPWNGGDDAERSTGGGGGVLCTTGPGVHNADTNAHFLMTAGHCAFGSSNNNFYNTQSGQFTGGRLLGNESVWFVGGTTMATAQIDSGLIPTSSSTYVFTGVYNSSSKVSIVADYSPGVNDYVCAEGASSGESCGFVTGINKTISFCLSDNNPCTRLEYVPYLLETSTFALGGDSGGPMYNPSGFGPLIAGTIVGKGPGIEYSMQIVQTLYGWSLYYSHAIEPNTVSHP